MAEVFVDYENTIAGTDGGRWEARACGRMGDGNIWEGWIEFVPLDRERKPIRSRRETTQPSRDDLLYWATGLTPVYLSGALTRAHPILDPFNVYAQGEDILTSQLAALDTSHLRVIARAYELMSLEQAESAARLDLASAIVNAARAHDESRL